MALDVLAALLAIAGVALVIVGGLPPSQTRSDAASALPQGPPAPTDSAGRPVGDTLAAPAGSAPARPTATPGGMGRSEPVHLAIPAIGVSTGLIPLGLNADGTIAVPPLGRTASAGWYRYLATPGEIGPSVILGHVDSARDGPAVFFRLIDLRPGDTVSVRRADGRTALFTVTRVEEYPKSAFPTEAVYGPLDHPELRLVTCGGAFDKLRRQYHGNVVAYATLADLGRLLSPQR
jgi:hypothetical protein